MYPVYEFKRFNTGSGLKEWVRKKLIVLDVIFFPKILTDNNRFCKLYNLNILNVLSEQNVDFESNFD